MRLDYEQKQNLACAKIGWPAGSFKNEIVKMYADELRPCSEIRDEIFRRSGVKFSERSMQRWIKKQGRARTIGDSFRLAVKQNRVNWAYKNPLLKATRKKLNPALRLAVFERDGFKCVFCGATKEQNILEVDHIIAVVKGGTNAKENLRVLCHTCNVGKQILYKEK